MCHNGCDEVEERCLNRLWSNGYDAKSPMRTIDSTTSVLMTSLAELNDHKDLLQSCVGACMY